MYMYIYIYICIYMCIYIYIKYMNMRTRKHTNMYSYTHTHTRTHTHTQGWCGRWRQRPDRSHISKVSSIMIFSQGNHCRADFRFFLATNLLVTTFLPAILEFLKSQLATSLKENKSIIERISRVSEGCGGY